MRDFQEAVKYCQFEDLGLTGPRFTWQNERDEGLFSQERLDRAFGNTDWCGLYPKAHVEVMVECSSDHAPLCISCSSSRGGVRQKPRCFRYEAGWSKKAGPKEIIKQVWRQKESINNSWQESKRELLQWRRKEVQPTKENIAKKSELPHQLQEGVGHTRQGEIKGLQAEISELFEQEELMWRQRAKMHWLKEGDKNTHFFHECVK
jgi:hypothetical protein